jgi:hypothetical protein
MIFVNLLSLQNFIEIELKKLIVIVKCRNKRPKAETVIIPKTIPDNKGSTILFFGLYKLL